MIARVKLSWQPRRGDRVRLRYWRTPTFGVVVAVGPEQSEVCLDGQRAALVYVNHELAPVVERVRLRLREEDA